MQKCPYYSLLYMQSVLYDVVLYTQSGGSTVTMVRGRAELVQSAVDGGMSTRPPPSPAQLSLHIALKNTQYLHIKHYNIWQLCILYSLFFSALYAISYY